MKRWVLIRGITSDMYDHGHITCYTTKCFYICRSIFQFEPIYTFEYPVFAIFIKLRLFCLSINYLNVTNKVIY